MDNWDVGQLFLSFQIKFDSMLHMYATLKKYLKNPEIGYEIGNKQ